MYQDKRKNALDFEVRRIDTSRVIEVIEVTTTAGNGTEADPVRKEIQFWTKEGRFIGILPPGNI